MVGLLPSRALALRLLSRGPSTPVLLSSLRVRHDQNTGHRTSPSHSNVETTHSRLGQIQNYATGVPTSRPGRPKAHTGRATASKRKPAASKGSSTSAAPKSTAAKKAAKTKRKTKTKAKPKTKAKLKTKAKPKPKPKPKPKRKTRVLTEQQKENKEKKAAALKQRNLRITALLTPPSATPPKQLPRTAYMVINAENQVKGTWNTDIAKASAAKYKALTPEERERANHIAHENQAKNEIAYKKWLESYTPAQIRDANKARKQLRAQAKADGIKKTYQHIKDDRLVKQPLNAYGFFLKDRVASGDMTGMRITEIGQLIGKEWKALSAADRKKYEDMQAMEKVRYLEEYKTVYGVDSPSVTKGKKA